MGYKYGGNIPLPNWDAAYAAQIVTQLNTAGPAYGTSFVQHFIIGNEPELGGWSYQDIYNNLSTFGYAMRQANLGISYNQNYPYNQVPILIVGPELSYYDSQSTGAVATFTSPTSNLNLIDPSKNTVDASNPVVDIFTFHYYAFVDEAVPDNWILTPNRTNVIATLQSSTTYPNSQPKPSFSSHLQGFKSANPTIKIGITEANICLGNDMNNVQTDDSDSGNGANGFIAGQFWAELMAVSAADKVELLNFWSVKEGQGGAQNRGFLDTRTGKVNKKKSTYHHYNMVAKNFSGTAYLGNKTSGPDNNFKVFASQGCSGRAVMVMNQNTGSTASNFDINFYNTTQTAVTGEYKYKINMGWNFTLTDAIDPNSSRVYVYDAMGILVKTIDYSLSDYSGDIAPTTTPNSSNPTPYGCPKAKKLVNSNVSAGYLNRCIPDTATGTKIYNNQTLSSSLAITDTAWIIGTLTVPNRVTLRIDSAEIVMSPSASIVVESGGELIIDGAYIHGCNNQTWAGIQATTTANTLKITNSTITDALVTLNAVSASEIEITNNLFSNDTLTNGTAGIKLEYCKNFTITSNEIISYDLGISTNNSARENNCYIQENLIYDVNYGFYSENDSHDYLDINCNGFSYNSGGIKAHSSTLKDQGTKDYGAGNYFISNSTNSNHQFDHDGNSITYYCDPSRAFVLHAGGGYAVTTSTAGADADCSGHGFRMIKNETANGVADLFLSCAPNPTSGKLNFTYLLVDQTIQYKLVLRNVLGVEVAGYNLPKNSTSFETDISSLANGIYFYTLYSGTKPLSTKKIVVSK